MATARYKNHLKPVILSLIKYKVKLEDGNKLTPENNVESSNSTEPQPTPAEDEQIDTKFNIEDRGENAPLLKSAAKINPYNSVNTIMSIALSIGIIVLLAGGVYLYSSKTNQYPTGGHKNSSHQMVPPGISGDSNNPIENIKLSSIPPQIGSASATRVYKDNKFSFTLNASTVEPAEGKYYVGWIYKDPQNPTYISLDRLEKMGDEYMLEFTSDQDYMGYNQVTISEESAPIPSGDSPQNHLFHGSF